MFNTVKNFAGWFSGTSSTPGSEEASGQGQPGTQATGPVELMARTHASGTTAGSSGSSSLPNAPRVSLQSLRSPGSQGSESPGSESSTEAFLSLPSSMRWTENVSVVSASGRIDVTALPDHDAPQPPVPRVDELRAELERALNRIDFSTTVPAEVEAQKVLQVEYLDRAAPIAALREKVFGTIQPYRLRASMATQTKEGLVSAVYESVQSFVTSAFRSPSGGAAGLSVAENEQFFPIDSALTTAVVQGALAYAAEGAMGAVNNRVTLSNMPKIARNNFEGLFYEQGVQANTVLLVMRNGAKEFMRADDPWAPAAASLAEQASRQLSAIKLRQDLLEGKSFSVIASPLLSGGFNTLRRFVSSPATLRSPAPVFLTSALASGAASGVTKLALEIGKTRAQVRMDDLVGGQQDLNLFRLNRPRPGAEPVRWSDAGPWPLRWSDAGPSLRLPGLVRFVGEAAWESLALAGEAARTFRHSAADMTYRYILVNGIANVSGIGAGGMVGQLFRKGRHFGALPGESPHSRGSIAAQMTQSTFGDLIWRVLKDGMKGREGDANASLGLRRKSRTEEQSKQAQRAQVVQREQDDLRTLVASLPLDSALWVAGSLTALADGAGDIESHGNLRNLRNRLQQQEPIDLQTLQGLQRQLTALDLAEADDIAQTDRNALVQQLGRIIQLLIKPHAGIPR